jgi:hypothetical protein
MLTLAAVALACVVALLSIEWVSPQPMAHLLGFGLAVQSDRIHDDLLAGSKGDARGPWLARGPGLLSAGVTG